MVIVSSKIIKLIQDISTFQMVEYSGFSEFKVELYEKKPIDVLGHWMALILVGNSDLKITFKTHYMASSVQVLLLDSYKKKVNEIDINKISDFVREYCNLVAGLLKRVFEEQGVLMGVSLPVSSRGFDEIYEVKANHGNPCENSFWKLYTKDLVLYCSARVEASSRDVLNGIDYNKLNINLKEDREIEFF